MPGLRVSTTELREAGGALRLVSEELLHADARSEDAAAYLGHAGLAAAVHDFAHEWNDRREKMVESITGLAEACTGVDEAFERLDRDLGATLRGRT